MPTLHARLLKLASLPILALLITVLSAASAGAQTITSRERVETPDSVDIYTYYAEGYFSHVHIDANTGDTSTYVYDFNTGHSTRIYTSTANGNYVTYIVSDSELGLINITNGWYSSPFYKSGNPFDASVQNSMALMFQELTVLEPGAFDWGGGGIRPGHQPFRP